MFASFPTLLPFLLFAFVASITPGPTNILVLSNSARYGLAAAMPIVFGGCAGAAAIVLLVGSGVGSSLTAFPAVLLQRTMRAMILILDSGTGVSGEARPRKKTLQLNIGYLLVCQ